mgnify:CR=1 FL=1
MTRTRKTWIQWGAAALVVALLAVGVGRALSARKAVVPGRLQSVGEMLYGLVDGVAESRKTRKLAPGNLVEAEGARQFLALLVIPAIAQQHSTDIHK